MDSSQTSGSHPTASAPEAGDASELLAFLIADIRGYTRFTAEQGDEAAAALAREFADLATAGVEAQGGRIIELRGDEALASFRSPRQALRAAAELQKRFEASTSVHPELPLSVGIGLDIGEAVPVAGGYRGSALNLAARLCGLAGPGEILASETLTHLAGAVRSVSYLDRGMVQVHGFSEPVHLVQVVPEGNTSQAKSGQSSAEADSVVHTSRQLPVGGFLGATPDTELVARAEEVELLEELLDAVASGAGQVLLISGETGIGKTRLAQEVILQACRRHFLVATGACLEQRQTSALYPMTEALLSLPLALREKGHLENWWPGLAGTKQQSKRAAHTTDDPGEEALFRRMAGFLLMLAAAGPVVLAIDDIHWADRATLELLSYLASHTRAYPIFIVATCSENLDREHPLRRTLLQLERQRLLSRMRLQRLAAKETAELIRATLRGSAPDQFATLVHRRTDGNPLFVREVVRSLVDRGDLFLDDQQWTSRALQETDIPETIRVLIEERLHGLGETTLELLRQASVLGRSFAFEDLQLTTSVEEEMLEAALEEAAAAGLVSREGPEDYAYHHGLIQETLYSELSPRRRRRLHLAAAVAIQRSSSARRSNRSAELAGHFLQGGDIERGLPYALQAGEEAEQAFAYEEAERLYRLTFEYAWQYTDSDENDKLRLEAQVLDRLGRVLLTAGRYREAEEALELAIQSFNKIHDAEGELRSTARIGVILEHLGREREGIERLQALSQQVSSEQPAAMAMALITLARLLARVHSYDESLRTAQRATELAGSANDEIMVHEAQLRAGEAMAMMGQHGKARRVLEEVVRSAEASDRSALTSALSVLGTTCLLAGQFHEAADYYRRSLELAERYADPRGTAVGCLKLARSLAVLGEWKQAASLLERAVAISESLGMRDLEEHGRLSIARIRILEGQDGDELEQRLDVESDHVRRLAELCLAERDLLAGKAEAALDRLRALGDSAIERAENDYPYHLLLAEAQLAASELAAAEDTALRTFERAAAERRRPEIAEALWLHGLVRARQHRRDEAVRLLEAALSLARFMPHPYLEARVLEALGVVDAESGRKDAEQLIRQAVTIFDRLGAVPAARRAKEQLATAT